MLIVVLGVLENSKQIDNFLQMCYNVIQKKRVIHMSTVTIRLNQEEEVFFKSYAQLTGKSLSSLFKKALERDIEDEYDLKIYQQAYAEYKEDPETISHADFKKELGL